MLVVDTEDQDLPLYKQIFTRCNWVDVSRSILNVCSCKAVGMCAKCISECGRCQALGTCADFHLEPLTDRLITPGSFVLCTFKEQGNYL